uniref:Copper transport protein ATX1 n=1 Tax=Noccaea caerulescens TaxID=107243 RepID=A0A1J3CXG6_NOCCA
MRISDIFCSSPASTAVRPTTLRHDGEVTGGRRSVERHRRRQNPSYNKDKSVPCFATDKPFIPIPRPIMSCRNSFESSSGFRRKITSAHGDVQTRRKSSADVSDLRRSRSSMQDSSSSRYLLKDHKYIKEDDKDLWLSSSDRSKDLIPFRDRTITSSSSSCSSSSSSSSSSVTNVSSPAPSTDDQVVVLRVSIHCKGCEGKVRKHISKMEGVTSYTIDIATKKVTVVGKVTPLGVVESISKVKFAQLWPSSSSPSFPHIPNNSLKA